VPRAGSLAGRAFLPASEKLPLLGLAALAILGLVIDDELRALQRARTGEMDERFLITLSRAGRVPRDLLERLSFLRHDPATNLIVEGGGIAPPEEIDIVEWLKTIASWSPDAALRLTQAALNDYFDERIVNMGFRGMDGPPEVFVRGLEAIDRWIVQPGTAARFEIEAVREMVVAVQNDQDGSWQAVGAANIIGRALLTITEPALAVDHAVSSSLEAWGGREDQLAEFMRGVRERLLPWLLGTGDPVAARAGLHGAHFGHERGIVRSISFDGAGTRALTTSADGHRTLWDVGARRRLRDLPAHARHRDLYDGALSPDGALALTFDVDGRLACFEVETGAQLWELDAAPHTKDGQVGGLVFLDGQRALSAHHSGLLAVWPIHREAPVAPLRILEGEASSVRVLAVSPDRRHAVTTGQTGLLRRWDLEAGAPSGALEVGLGDEGGGVADVAYTADGARVVAAMDRDRVVVWSAGSGERLAVHTLPPNVSRMSSSVTAIATSAVGRRLAVGRDRVVDLLDVDTGASSQRLWVLGLPLALAWSPQGQLLVGMRGGALRTIVEAPPVRDEGRPG